MDRSNYTRSAGMLHDMRNTLRPQCDWYENRLFESQVSAVLGNGHIISFLSLHAPR